MAGAYVQSNHNRANSVTSLAVSLTGVTAGNTLAGICASYGATNITGCSGGGATWTERSGATSGSNARLEIWIGVGTTGGSFNVTFTSASAALAAIVMEISGLDASSPFDVQAAAAGSGTSPDSGATAALAQADSFKVSACSHEGGTISMNPRAGDGDTEVPGEEEGNSFMVAGGAYQVLTTTAAINGRWTLGASNPWMAAVVVLKAAAGGGGKGRPQWKKINRIWQRSY